MIWTALLLSAAAMATVYEAEPVTHLLDNACNPVAEHSVRTNRPLRFVWSQYMSSTVDEKSTEHTVIYKPEEIRVREAECRVDPSHRWASTARSCRGVRVLSWSGPLRSGTEYVIEAMQHGRHDNTEELYRFTTEGPKAPPSCMEEGEDESDLIKLSTEVESSVNMPPGSVVVDGSQTIVDHRVLSTLTVSGAMNKNRRVFASTSVGEGSPTQLGRGTIIGQWKGTLTTTKSTGTDFHGGPLCHSWNRHEGELTIPGVARPFTVKASSQRDSVAGACTSAHDSAAIKTALLADLQEQLGKLDVLAVPQANCTSSASGSKSASVDTIKCGLATTGSAPPEAIQKLIEQFGSELPSSWDHLTLLAKIADEGQLADVNALFKSLEARGYAPPWHLLKFRKVLASPAFRDNPAEEARRFMKTIGSAYSFDLYWEFAQRLQALGQTRAAYSYSYHSSYAPNLHPVERTLRTRFALRLAPAALIACAKESDAANSWNGCRTMQRNALDMAKAYLSNAPYDEEMKNIRNALEPRK